MNDRHLKSAPAYQEDYLRRMKSCAATLLRAHNGNDPASVRRVAEELRSVAEAWEISTNAVHAWEDILANEGERS
jgi:flagellin-specific chaperone FliS